MKTPHVRSVLLPDKSLFGIPISTSLSLTLTSALTYSTHKPLWAYNLIPFNLAFWGTLAVTLVLEASAFTLILCTTDWQKLVEDAKQRVLGNRKDGIDVIEEEDNIRNDTNEEKTGRIPVETETL